MAGQPTPVDESAQVVRDVDLLAEERVAIAAQRAAEGDTGFRPVARLTQGDLVFAYLSRGSGALVLVIMALVAVFLARGGATALGDAGLSFFTTFAWDPNSGRYGIPGILAGTILIGVTATVIAVPFAIATALFISEYAPARLKPTFVSIIDLMAAVPSVIYGLWGAFFLQGSAVGAINWIVTYFGWLPLVSVRGYDPRDPLATDTALKSSTFMAAMVVGMMIVPIASSIMREAFSQAPIGEREGAYALGSTRWGMIRSVVLPYGRGAIVGGTMLAAGRALGETITIAMIISPVYSLQPHIFEKGAISVSALIALRYSEATQGSISLSALFAAGLVLFLMTMAVNFLASMIVARSRSGGSDV